MTPYEAHIEARLVVDRMKAAGAKFDKKLLRWNDIVTVVMAYQDDGASAKSGLLDAICCCVVGSSSYDPGRGPLTLMDAYGFADN